MGRDLELLEQTVVPIAGNLVFLNSSGKGTGGHQVGVGENSSIA